ncbi:hypothetical protein [Crenothrix polyspora]|uniref:Uncharacterized protein n=1 Tax=Crenothrix polyspora TaxID=360316 RepID=A0A1R4HHK3_9GAMM|nr:hypothetical protein [Crenothrix polyspora]SJM95716.1 exported hypothetical protein [Crenothrix polyspora]
MNRLLPSFITSAVFVLSFAGVGTALADPFGLTANCALPNYVPNKCGLTIRLNDIATTVKTIKQVVFSVQVTDKNGKFVPNSKWYPVYNAYNDTVNNVTSFAAFSTANNIAVSCGKSYNIKAHITGSATPEVFNKQVIACPSINKAL